MTDTSSGGYSVTAGDIDDDGAIDIISGSGNSKWFENNGAGTSWTSHTISASHDPCSSRDAVDLDDDADIDIVCLMNGGGDPNVLYWFENDLY